MQLIMAWGIHNRPKRHQACKLPRAGLVPCMAAGDRPVVGSAEKAACVWLWAGWGSCFARVWRWVQQGCSTGSAKPSCSGQQVICSEPADDWSVGVLWHFWVSIDVFAILLYMQLTQGDYSLLPVRKHSAGWAVLICIHVAPRMHW
jgi:hypothetical protein